MANPSPSCEVKNGSAAYVTAVGGVDVTPGATVVIRLSSQADVDSWLIECATTDDTSDAATVTASLTIDSTAKTATFTAPAAGKAYRFRSRVNGGIDRNGTAQTSYTTTFGIYTRINGRRVAASDETTETDSTFGWSKWTNDIIRSIPSGVPSGTWSGFGAGAPGGSDHQFQYISSSAHAGATGLDYVPTTGVVKLNRGLLLSGTAVATLANAALVGGTAATGYHLVQPVMQSPIMGGTAVFTGTDIIGQGDAYIRPYSVLRKALTTNATVTPIFAWRLKDEAVTSVTVEMNAVASGAAAGGSYVRRQTFLADGGVATATPTSTVLNINDEHTNAGFTGIAVGSGLIVGASGLTGFVNIKGTPTGQIRWGGVITVLETPWA